MIIGGYDTVVIFAVALSTASIATSSNVPDSNIVQVMIQKPNVMNP
jgi:hypothetical protein